MAPVSENPSPRGWHFDEIPQGLVHHYGSARLDAGDVALFHAHFAPNMPLHVEQAPDLERGPPAAQAHIYALWTRMLWNETQNWPVLRRLGQDALRYFRTAHAGDILSVQMSFVGKDDLAHDRGLLIASHEIIDQHGALVMSVMTRTILAKSPK